MPLNAIATKKAIRYINWKLIISFIKGCRLFFQTRCKHPNNPAGWARVIVFFLGCWGAAQTRNF